VRAGELLKGAIARLKREGHPDPVAGGVCRPAVGYLLEVLPEPHRAFVLDKIEYFAGYERVGGQLPRAWIVMWSLLEPMVWIKLSDRAVEDPLPYVEPRPLVPGFRAAPQPVLLADLRERAIIGGRLHALNLAQETVEVIPWKEERIRASIKRRLPPELLRNFPEAPDELMDSLRKSVVDVHKPHAYVAIADRRDTPFPSVQVLLEPRPVLWHGPAAKA